MAKSKPSYDEILKLAESYGIADNVLFRTAAERYSGQMELISISQDDIRTRGLMVEHMNVRGTVSMEPNPLIAQIPKMNDAANKTLAAMIDIIQKLGTSAPAGDKLGEFLSE